jgi:hypothetical protein
VVRDVQTIQTEIERARDGLAAAVDELSTRVNPRRTIDEYKRRAQQIWDDPKVKYSAIGIGAVVLALMIRKLVR